jgi:hypothetical protein
MYWLTSVGDKEDKKAEQYIKELLDVGWYLFGHNTGGRSKIQAGDKICFYVKRRGVVASATIESQPSQSAPSRLQAYSYGKHDWAFRVSHPNYFFDQPFAITRAICAGLEAFRNRDLSDPRSWVWFVQGTHAISEHDYRMLTRAG